MCDVVALSTFTVLCDHYYYHLQNFFIILNRNSVHLFPPPHGPLVTCILLSFYRHLPPPGPSDK